MKFEEKLKKYTSEEIWQEYCGFLDLSVDEYMHIQNRLLLEQIEIFGKSGLGKQIFGDDIPTSVEEFRKNVPFTTYEDYADTLLMKRISMLPAEPVVWLQTTWEGGGFPAKIAPYSAGMLETCRKNAITAIIMSSSTGRARFRVKQNGRLLYSLAPMPYITGLFPEIIDSEFTFKWLPALKDTKKMSFAQKSKKGFELGIKGGIDYMFGMSSILHGMSLIFDSSLNKGGSKLTSIWGTSPRQLIRLLIAKYRCKRDNRPIMPKDIFSISGFVCAGTDSTLYKDELEHAWGVRPLEIFGGTEPSLMGVETWSRNGLVFFPDVCFYEFIPENEMRRAMQHPGYVPHSYLMNELVANQCYELVITVFKGGSLVRYRVGDVYRCLRLKNRQDNLDLPQFEYIDRVPNIIDIAGFTRITKKEIETVIKLSCLPIGSWFALKEYDADNRSYLHIYLESTAKDGNHMIPHIIKEHMNVYFRYYDGDYKDLKKILSVDPLKVTVLKYGTMKRYKTKYGVDIPQINPSLEEVIEIMRLNYKPDVKAVKKNVNK